jgi:DNA-binding CsgD family transcriptional regulator
MRYRFATTADLPTCQDLVGPTLPTGPPLLAELPQLWKSLLNESPASLTVIEDPEKRYPESIEAFAACVFVDDAFLTDFLAAPSPYLSAIVYQRVLEGNSPILSASAIRDKNSGSGLNLVCLHFCLRNPDVQHPATRSVLQVANTAFFFFFAGYRINALVQEVYGARHAQYLEVGGLRLISNFGATFARGGKAPPLAEHPYLFGLRKEEISPTAFNPLSYFFHSLTPRFHFSNAAQRVLERAMLNETDAEIATRLGVSLDAVKKSWRSIYERVDEVAPRMFGSTQVRPHEGHRSVEKRRHLLEYLRTHLEELRPTNHSRLGRSVVPAKLLGREH